MISPAAARDDHQLMPAFDHRVRYDLYSAFKIVTAHERRHLWQAEHAVEALHR
jgi:hypothetical protein